MATFEDLKAAMATEIAQLRAAYNAKQKAGGDMALMKEYLGLQFQLDQKLRKRGLRGAELDIAMKALIEVVQKV